MQAESLHHKKARAEIASMLWWTVQNLIVCTALAAMISLSCRLWRIGPIALAAIQLLRIIRMILRLRRALPPDPSFQQCVDDLAKRLKLRPGRIRIVPGLTSPVIFALAGPQLLWPAELPASVDTVSLH